MNFRSLLENSRSLTNTQLDTQPQHFAAGTLGDKSVPVHSLRSGMETDPVAEVAMPRIERPLDQLELQSRKLWQKATRTRDGASDVRA